MDNIQRRNDQSISNGDVVESSNETSSSVTNLCIACGTSQRAVVFVPCGHYITCLPCGHGMEICPICRSKVAACLRIYE